jgi:hypothetical protein
MYIKSGAYQAARNEVYVLKAIEILWAQGDTVGAKATEAAYARMRKANEAAYSESMMDWPRVGNSTTENLK